MVSMHSKAPACRTEYPYKISIPSVSSFGLGYTTVRTQRAEHLGWGHLSDSSNPQATQPWCQQRCDLGTMCRDSTSDGLCTDAK